MLLVDPDGLSAGHHPGRPPGRRQEVVYYFFTSPDHKFFSRIRRRGRGGGQPRGAITIFYWTPPGHPPAIPTTPHQSEFRSNNVVRAQQPTIARGLRTAWVLLRGLGGGVIQVGYAGKLPENTQKI